MPFWTTTGMSSMANWSVLGGLTHENCMTGCLTLPDLVGPDVALDLGEVG
jgi:hypothetical protein